MKMKGITCCGDCVYYNIKKHKCIRCENVEPEDAREHFYADCPLPDVETVRHGKWLIEAHKEKTNNRWNVTAECSECAYDLGEIWAGFFPGIPDGIAENVCFNSAKSVDVGNYCPNCGAKMDGD